MFHEWVCVCVCVSKCLSVCRRTCQYAYVCNCVSVCDRCVNARVYVNVFFPFSMCECCVCERETECVHVKSVHPKWTTPVFPRSERKKAKVNYGTFRSRNSSVRFQTSFTLSEVKSIKHTHAHKHTHADKRVVSVTLVNRVGINLIVPT